MAHAVRGFPLLLVYSGGFSAIWLICHFNAPVRRFNVWCYPLYRRIPACPVALVYGLVARRCPLLRGVPLARCAASLPPSSFPRGLVGGCTLLRWCAFGGLWPPVSTSPCVALRQSRRHSRSTLCESRWQIRCKSRKCLRQSRSFCPKIIVVYKIPCIKAGFFLPAFP